MSVYLDASVLVALFTQDAFTQRATVFLEARLPTLIVSDFAAVDFASFVSRLVRIGELGIDEARAVLANFDTWRLNGSNPIAVASSDIAAAATFIRRLDLTLRTADAINLAVAQRLAATVATFDTQMSASARALGIQLADA